MKRECNDCGAVDWNELIAKTKGGAGDSDPVEVTIYKCRYCGSEGRLFEDPDGSITYSGALR